MCSNHLDTSSENVDTRHSTWKEDKEVMMCIVNPQEDSADTSVLLLALPNRATRASHRYDSESCHSDVMTCLAAVFNSAEIDGHNPSEECPSGGGSLGGAPFTYSCSNSSCASVSENTDMAFTRRRRSLTRALGSLRAEDRSVTQWSPAPTHVRGSGGRVPRPRPRALA